MGALLDQYLSTFGQSLQALSAPPGGAQTFPAAGPGSQPLDPNLAAMPQPPTFQPQPGGMTAAGLPVGQTFDTGGQVMTAPAPSFEEQPTPGVEGVPGGGGAATPQPLMPFEEEQPVDLPTFEEPPPTPPGTVPAEGLPGGTPPIVRPEDAAPAPEGAAAAPGEPRGRGKGGAQVEEGEEILQAGDVESPEDLMAAATDEEIAKGTDVVEQQLEEQGSSLDEAYAKVTGGPPDTRLSREEKGQLLMEFGLRMLAYSGQEGAEFEAIGRAGIETLGSARAMREQKRRRPIEEQKEQLEMDLTRAQMEAAQRTRKEVTTDAEGNMIIVDTETGNRINVTDADGNSVKGGAQEARRFEKEVAREMYRAVRCTGMSGDELQTCEVAALAYASGGAGTVLAFPEVMDRENTTAALKVLLDEDAQYTKHTIPSTGERKTIADMTGEERAEIVAEYAKMWGVQPDEPRGTAEEAPTGWEAVGMTEEEARQLPPNQRVRHPDGGFVANRDGKLVRLDENGQVMQ